MLGQFLGDLKGVYVFCEFWYGCFYVFDGFVLFEVVVEGEILVVFICSCSYQIVYVSCVKKGIVLIVYSVVKVYYFGEAFGDEYSLDVFVQFFVFQYFGVNSYDIF